MEPTILYEDRDIAAINKPAGLMVHSDGRSDGVTLADWVAKQFPQAKGVGEPARGRDGLEIIRGGIVHRLDRETSGVMLIAKTAAGFDCLKRQFQSRTIKKEYHCFVYGEMKTDRGVIDRPIGRSASDFRKWSAQRGAKGELREAVTEYAVAKRGRGYSFVHAFPKTGRTHQIRVHFKAVHHPIVSDSLYAPGHSNDLGFSRLALHSHAITFESVDSTQHTVLAPYPEDFTRALTVLQK